MIKILIFLSLTILSLGYVPCTAGCIKCVFNSKLSDEDNPIYECLKCADGFYMDKKANSQGCIENCKESDDITKCKTCDEIETYKCKQCWEEEGYKLVDYYRCEPYFAICNKIKFFDCMYCNTTVINESYVFSQCYQCFYHYTLVDGECVYDFNYKDKSNYININILLLFFIWLLI